MRLSRKAIYTLDTGELDRALDDALGAAGAPMTVEFALDIRFGMTDYTPLADLARRIVDTFPAQLLRVEFARGAEWHIAAIRMRGPGERERQACRAVLRDYAGLARGAPAVRSYRYRIAVLHDANEELAPSNPRPS